MTPQIGPVHLGPVGLLGRILAIVLAAIAFEFAASTFLYERAETLRVHEEEAHRVAEHVALVHQFLASRPPAERAAAAERLSSNALQVRWSPGQVSLPPVAPELASMREQIVEWEPMLAGSDLRLYLESPGRNDYVRGVLGLEDGSSLTFKTRAPHGTWSFTLNRLLSALIPAVALVIIAGLLIRRTLRPMDQLARAADAIGHGEEVILQPSGPEEVRQVVHAFNGMQRRINHLIVDRTQALAAVGHDLRTPIARLQLRTEQVADPDLRQSLQEDAAEMEQMLDSLLSYLGGDRDPEPPVRTDLAVLVETIVDDAADHGGDVIYDGPDHLDAEVRPAALKRAIRNLVENALHYGGSARVSLAPAPFGDPDPALVLAVEDEGPGIPEGRLAEALEPFARLDSARGRNTRGLGLGLAIAKRAAENEGGALRLSNRRGGGLRAEIRLPRHPVKS